MTSHEAQLRHTDVLTTLWRQLWSITDQTHGNMYQFDLYDNKAECWERCFSSYHESGTKKKLIKLYGETIQMKAIEQFFSSCVSVYQAVHRGFNLKSLDKLWCATT